MAEGGEPTFADLHTCQGWWLKRWTVELGYLNLTQLGLSVSCVTLSQQLYLSGSQFSASIKWESQHSLPPKVSEMIKQVNLQTVLSTASDMHCILLLLLFREREAECFVSDFC